MMTFALFLHLAHSSDSLNCFLQSHLFSSNKPSETTDLKDLSCVGCILGIFFLKSPSSFSVFRCPYFSLFQGSFPVFFCFSQGTSLSRFYVIRSLTHPRRSPEPGWPSCHSWCGSPCHSFRLCFLSFALGVLCGIFSFLLF